MLKATPPLNSTIISFETTSTYLHIRTDRGQLKLTPYDAHIVRVSYSLEEAFPKEASLGVIAEPTQVPWSLKETEDYLELETQALKLRISRATSSLSYYRPDGTLLLEEAKYNGKTLEAYSSYKKEFDDETQVVKVETPDGIKERIVGAREVYDRELYRGFLRFEWQEGEALYGLGQHEEGNLNLRGHKVYLHQANKKIAVPFLVSTKGYGLLVETYAPMVFSDDEFGAYLYVEAVQALEYYFIAGDGLDKVIDGYRSLSGQATMLPRWAFGYMQSFERYEDAVEIIDTVKTYRERAIPLDCIVLDWQSWEGEQWGQKTFDPVRFPDPKAMTDELHSLGAHFMISVWPNMRKMTDNYKVFKAQGGLLPMSELYNPFDPAARQLYWQQMNEGLFQYGIDAWWTDSCEPFAPEWPAAIETEASVLMWSFHDTAKSHMDATKTNAYGLMHARTVFEGQRRMTKDKRVTNLTRSAYTGQQRYGVIPWSGDIAAKWSTLKDQIPAGLNMCASGFPYWTLDIGAFFTKRAKPWFWNGDYEEGCKDPAYRELYIRWFQYATFLPIFRAHGTDTRREVWQFGEADSPSYQTLVAWVKLRYQLLPYIYSLSAMVSNEAYTMMRLLAFDFLADEAVYDIKDQYMFGPSILVCPITEAVYKRALYLPKGSLWYDYWTNETYEGGQTIEADAPLDKIPLYIKAASILPMARPMQYTDEADDSHYDLHIYKGGDASFTLYQDANDGYDYEAGDYRSIELTWKDEESSLEIIESWSQNMEVAPMTFDIYVNGQAQGTVNYNHEALKVNID